MKVKFYLLYKMDPSLAIIHDECSHLRKDLMKEIQELKNEAKKTRDDIKQTFKYLEKDVVLDSKSFKKG